MNANEPSVYLKTVLRKYATNLHAIEDQANKANANADPKHLMAIAAVSTLLDFITINAKR